MKIAGITKFRHGLLHEALELTGMSQKELSRVSGVCYGTINKCYLMQYRPTKETAQKIQNAIASRGVFFDVEAAWPEAFSGLKGNSRSLTTYEEIPISNLIDYVQPLQLSAPEQSLVDKEKKEVLEEVLNTLSDREAYVLEECVMSERSLDDVADEWNVGRERVRQIKEKALRKMRNPLRIEALAEVWGEEIN